MTNVKTNFAKYRKQDLIQFIGCFADVYKENEQGELIDSICCKDASWLSEKPITAISEDFNFEGYILDVLNKHFCTEIKENDVCICGNLLMFWIQENEDGYDDDNGEYFVEYSVRLSINGISVEEEDLFALCTKLIKSFLNRILIDLAEF